MRSKALTIFREDRRSFLKSAAASGGIALLSGCSRSGSESEELGSASAALATPTSDLRGLREHVDHIIVIYQENRSFDHYFGAYQPPGGGLIDGLLGADGSLELRFNGQQKNAAGMPYKYLPMPYRIPGFARGPLPNQPFHLAPYIPPDDNVPYDPTHQFYRMFAQINQGKMDRFVSLAEPARRDFFNKGRAYTPAETLLANATPSGAVLGFYKREDLPDYHRLADEHVLFDHFFQAMSGGSTGNALYLVGARSCHWSKPPKQKTDPASPAALDRPYDENGFLVNDVPPLNGPTETYMGSIDLCPPPEEQTHPHIGARLESAGKSWAWYAEGWSVVKPWALKSAFGPGDGSVVVDSPENYVPHHNPFQYFPTWFTHVKRGHIRDSDDFLDDLRSDRLPEVCFLKATGSHDEHPANSAPRWGEQWVMGLLRALAASRFWAKSLVLITYDEGGGYWDHVAPPKRDAFGCGTRIPALLISPWARRGYIDHRVADTTSILALIEARFALEPLDRADAQAYNLLDGLDFSQPPRAGTFG
jgi:phospholipase C